MKARTLFLTHLLSFALVVHAQAPLRDSDTGKFTYQDVVQVDSATVQVLFQRAEGWYEQEFKTAQLDLRNDADSKLAHTGSFPVKWTFKKYVQEVQVVYTISIECREGRYRYMFTDFRVSQSVNATTESQTLEAMCDYVPPVGKKNHEDMEAQILAGVDTHIKKCLAELETIMSGVQASGEKW